MKRYTVFQFIILSSCTFSLLTMDIGQLYRQLEQQEVGQDNIKLISKEGAEFIVPLAVAKQSETIKHLLSDIGTTQLSFETISSATLKEIVELLKELFKHPDLKHKALLDTLDKSMVINDSVALLHAANYLDINPIIQLAARKIAQQEKERYSIAKFFNEPQIAKKLPKDLVKIIAHYYFLLAGKNYSYTTTTQDLGFSIQDYLDYQPDKIKFFEIAQGGLGSNLSNLFLNSLDGLQNIPNKDKITYLVLENNKLETIEAKVFNGFNNLSTLHINHNILKKVDFPALNKLQNLNLSHNQLTDFPPKLQFPNLVLLDISHNQLERLVGNQFSGCPKLQSINLNYNRLNTIEPEAFLHLKKLFFLNLSSNELTTIPLTAFDSQRIILEIRIDSTVLKSTIKELQSAVPPMIVVVVVPNKRPLGATGSTGFSGVPNIRY